jgi:methanogenic corrinoid protein MtbC1
MAKGYSAEEIREKLISILSGSSTGMSGVEISEKMKINRITMSKYLKVFAADGLVRQKNIGNTNLWFLEPGQESFEFPDDYFKITNLFQEFLQKGSETEIQSLIKNSIHSGGETKRLILEVFLPAIELVKNQFDSGKIGFAEQNLLRNIIFKSLQIFNQHNIVPDSKKNAVLIAADYDSHLICDSAATIFNSSGWRVSNLGDMSSAINLLFDLDFQKLLSKIWKQKPGILIVVVFSQTTEGLNFFTDSINPLKEKFGKQMKVILSGKSLKKTKTNCDLFSEKLDDIIQWSETTFENSN